MSYEFDLCRELELISDNENNEIRIKIKTIITKHIQNIRKLNLNQKSEEQKIRKLFIHTKNDMSEYITNYLNKMYSTYSETGKWNFAPNDIPFLVGQDPSRYYSVKQSKAINDALQHWLIEVTKEEDEHKICKTEIKSEKKNKKKQSRQLKCNCAIAYNGTLEAHWCSPDTAGIPIEREKIEKKI